MSLAKIGEVISSVVTGGKRLIKVRLLGKDDIQEVVQVSPHGIDSAPPTGTKTKALHIDTLQRGSSVVVAYVNKNQQAKDGELRLSSTNADGVEQTFIYLHDNGDIDIGGTGDNMVRYSELKSAFDELKSDFNTLVSLYNSHTHLTTATVSSSPIPGIISPTTSQGTPSIADVSGAKIDEIKTL